MWRKEFSQIYSEVTKEHIWEQWENVTQWPQWDTELEYCQLDQPFVAGNHFILKAKGGPKVKVILSRVEPLKRFTDYCHFIGAKMIDDHFLEETPQGLRITNIISMTGPLAFLWWWLVGRKVASSVPVQTENLVKYVQQ
jgi:hypothetical protein